MFGNLRMQGNKIIDKDNNPIRLKRMSLYWSQWSTPFYSASTVSYLALTVKSRIVRAAMGAQQDTNGYLDGKMLRLPMVCISLSTGIHMTPFIIHIKQATFLFRWSTMSSQSPITAYNNVAYTFHFYAESHRDELCSKAQTALNNSIALLVTEWGICDTSGNGHVNLAESEEWINFTNSNKLSWCNWPLNDKEESASALKFGTGSSQRSRPWNPNDLTQSSSFVFSKISGESTISRCIALPSNVNGKFVCADNAGNNSLIANHDTAFGRVTFDLISFDGNNVALKSHANRQYVCVENAGDGPLIANRTTVDSWETFDLVQQ